MRFKLSESAVKQMSASKKYFSLRRLNDICDAIGIDLAEFIEIAAQRT
jgi:DNA-binding Xre family transcriptional regulator